MFLSKLFKRKSTKLLTLFGALAMALGVGAAASYVASKQQNEAVETKAEADTTYNTDQIVIHVIDDKYGGQTSSGHDFWMHCWNITVDTEYSIFGDISDANEASALWSKLNYNSTNKTFDVAGNYEWFQNGDYGRRSYKFDFPWFVTGFQFEVSLNGAGCGTKPTVSSRQYTRWYFKENWSFEGDGKETKSAKYDAPAYTMSFNTNGGSSQSSFVFREWQKTSQPGSSPTKDMQKFVKWTETNDSSASAFAFGSNLTAPITLYAQWTYHMIVWLPSGDRNNAYCWYNDGADHNDGTWPGKSGGTFTVDGTNYSYVTVGIDATWVIFSNNGSSQTADLPIPSGAMTGEVYYDVANDTWEPIEMDIVYKDQGDVAYSGTTGSTRPTKHNYALTTTIPTDMGKTGYTFGGWYTNSSCTGAAVTSITAYSRTTDLTLYAKWTAKTFTITFNANGGSGTVSSLTLTYGSEGTLRANAFTAPDGGHIFKEWNNKADGTGAKSYTSGASLTIEQVNALYSLSPVGSKTLYAIWSSGQDAAIAFATTFNDDIGGACDDDGVTTDKAALAEAWGDLASIYTSDLAAHVKWWLQAQGRSSNAEITEMIGNNVTVAKYDYVYSKYCDELELENFLGHSKISTAMRIPSGYSDNSQSPLTTTLWIVLASGLAGLAAIGTAYFVSKKKRHQA